MSKPVNTHLPPEKKNYIYIYGSKSKTTNKIGSTDKYGSINT